MILKTFWRILSWPFRSLTKLLGRNVGSGAAVNTTAKSGGSAIAKAVSIDILEEEYKEEPPSGIEAAMFRQLPRPRLTEKSASDLTLDQAQSYAEQAKRFYQYKFPLFPRGDFFYEEIEDQFLNAALGYEANSIDQRFVDVTTLFRKTLNANTRQMLLVWAPLIGLATFVFASLAVANDSLIGQSSEAISPAIIFGGAVLVAGFMTFLVYSWPYKVVQQRNLMNLDNYVTSKFARINNNFQVAKRRALNVERDKRMSEREALKNESGDWTLSYHWFASRLFLCETMLRNKFYQIRRNTTLYWVGSLTLTLIFLAGLGAVAWAGGAPPETVGAFGIASAAYLLLSGLVTMRATGMMFRVLESNEWSRFHIINLDQTIRDHVGEDKLQIVTFRDRNRFE